LTDHQSGFERHGPPVGFATRPVWVGSGPHCLVVFVIFILRPVGTKPPPVVFVIFFLVQSELEPRCHMPVTNHR
jgi:hypothetical protein